MCPRRAKRSNERSEITPKGLNGHESKNITDMIINALQDFVSPQSSTPIKKIDKELRTKLDAILASGDETEYVRHNPILREKVESGLMAFKRGESFTVSPEQLGIQMDN
jgi:hypothetical protein